ncbi:PAS domain S-box protein [Devosia sp. LjRoot3]|uniref:PAS domain S-box protein n=1 Tax=Devosia sp. LjRoot3 TaxID=3342319 RepID=UPI003ECCA45B
MSLARTAQRRVTRPRRTQRAVPVLSRLAEIAPVGMLVTGLDGAVRYLNPAFTRLLGHKLEVGHNLDGFGLIHPDDTGAARQHLVRLARGETTHYRGEHRLIHADGHPIWVMLAAALSTDDDGHPDCLILQVTSIELQKRAEEALAYSESRWNHALEGARQGVWDHDIRRDTMFYSRMWRKMRGIPADEEVDGDQVKWLQRIHPEDRPHVMANVHRQDQGDNSFDALEYRELTRDGRYIWILSRGRPVEWDESGEPLRTIGTDTDITYLKTVEQELAAEKERLRVTLEAIADGMIATDGEGRVTFINPAAERFTGFSAAEAKGLLAEAVFPLRHAHSNEAAPCPAVACLTHRQAMEVEDEVVLVSRDGQARDIRCSASPVTTPDGKVSGAVLVFQDITQSRALQRQLVHSASHDVLTGLPNRAAFDRAMSTAMTSARDGQRQHCLLYVDLDRFKPVNDTAGHAAGDALLKQVAETIRGACRGHDLAARLGGDEFAVLLEDCPLANGRKVAEKIVRAIASLAFSWNGRLYRIGASIGVTVIKSRSESGLGYLGEADAACYAAKAGGRGQVVCFAEMTVDQP